MIYLLSNRSRPPNLPETIPTLDIGSILILMCIWLKRPAALLDLRFVRKQWYTVQYHKKQGKSS